MKSNDETLLRRALRANALFSTFCGLTLVIGGGALGPVLGVPALALRLVGATLLPFAFGLWRNAGKEQVNRAEAWIAVALDLVWVIASAALVLGSLWPLTSAGRWVVIGVADFVLLWAILQIAGLVRSAPRTVVAQ